MSRFSTFRRLRSSLLGPPSAPDNPDSLDQARIDLSCLVGELERLIDGVREFESTVRNIGSSHGGLSTSLREYSFVAQDANAKCKLERSISAFATFQSLCTQFSVDPVIRKASKLADIAKRILKSIDERDIALGEKVHYESKLAEVTNSGDPEKLARNRGKLEAAEKHLALLDERTLKEIASILDTREESMTKLISEFDQIQHRWSESSLVVFESLQRLSVPVVEVYDASPSRRPSAPYLDDDL